ncbi:hypothetical protein Q3G72_033025 [Acer saccharum]|nr:hypothetical protein Q3G72_033025 [Acer saccharum]
MQGQKRVNYGTCTKYDTIPISDLTKRIEETGENKNKKEKKKKKYIDVSIGVNVESGVWADDEAKAEEVDTEIGDSAADDEARAKEVYTKIGVFDDNGTSKHQSQWDFEKLRGVIQSKPKVEEVIDQELMIAFNRGRFSLNESVFEHDGDDCVVFVGGVYANDKTKTEDVETKIGDFDDDKAKVEEVENSAGVNVESGVFPDDEAKAEEVDTEIGECLLMMKLEQRSGVCADDEAKAEDVETEIGVFDDDKAKTEEVKNSANELTTYLN